MFQRERPGNANWDMLKPLGNRNSLWGVFLLLSLWRSLVDKPVKKETDR